MTQEEFKFDYRWIEQIKLKDIEDWELITNESWEEFNRYGGAPVYRDDKPVKVDGEILRRNNMTCTIAFIYILKRTQDSTLTVDQVRELPIDVLNVLYRSLTEYLTKLVADADPKSQAKKTQTGDETKDSRNDKA